MNARQRAGAACLIVAATFLAGANSLHGPFVFLDVAAIADNPTIRHLWPLSHVLHPPLTRGVTVEGRPLLNLSFAVNYAFSQGRVVGYHLGNLAIHACAGLALFGWLRRMLKRDGVALAIALLWVAHPLQTESVTYLVQRAESLMGLFYLLTLYASARALDSPRPTPWLVLSAAACLCGMGTKEVMVSAPLIVLLADRQWGAGSLGAALRRRRLYYAALAATWIPLLLFVAGTGGNRGGTSGFGLGISWTSYLLTQFPAVVHYVRLALWPHPLVFYYAVEWVRLGAALPAAIVVLALFAASCWACCRRLPQGFFGVWFFAILAPTSLVPGISQLIAEHRMYLALAPLIAVVVPSLARLVPLPRRLIPAVVAAVAAGLVLTAGRNRVYASEVALWADTIRKVPTNPYTQNNFGVALASAGKPEQAAEHFRAAIALNPRYPAAYANLGLAYAARHELDAALTNYRRSLELDPANGETYADFGVALANRGRGEEAIAAFRQAVRLRPDDAGTHGDLAVALARAGDLPAAIAEYHRALELAPDTAEIHFDLANALAAAGRWAEAVDAYARAAKLDPGSADTHANLGAALAQCGRVSEAIVQYRAALALRPDDPDVRYNLELAEHSQPAPGSTRR